MNQIETDVVIVGAGLAGMYTALMLPDNLRILLVSKADVKETNSYLAQGGIAAAMIKENDSPEKHYEDTLKSGRYFNDPETVKILVAEAEENMHALENLGVGFDRDASGNYLMGMEGAHSVARILRIGDHTGRSIMEVLSERVEESENIVWIKPFFGVDLLMNEGIWTGIKGLLNGTSTEIYSNFTILATGGIGHLYSFTSNSSGIDGSGIAMAIRAGVKTAHMNRTQFHPTVFYTPELEGRQFLISEAVRGEGAILRNHTGERFMERYDERLELAPRDVVSSAIEKEMTLNGTNCVYLDVIHLSRTFLKERFPTIYAFCLTQGIQMDKDLIPVAPRLHYFMGGIQTDVVGRTSVEGLFAVGECAHTGVHGLNRLASNSLLEAVVFGKRIAREIEKVNPKKGKVLQAYAEKVQESIPYNIKLETLKGWMDRYMGINRDPDELKTLYQKISKILDSSEVVTEVRIENIRIYNALLIMQVMVSDAIKELNGND